MKIVQHYIKKRFHLTFNIKDGIAESDLIDQPTKIRQLYDLILNHQGQLPSLQNLCLSEIAKFVPTDNTLKIKNSFDDTDELIEIGPHVSKAEDLIPDPFNRILPSFCHYCRIGYTTNLCSCDINKIIENRKLHLTAPQETQSSWYRIQPPLEFI